MRDRGTIVVVGGTGEISWKDQKPFVVTQRHLDANWNGRHDGSMFRCYLCGHFFELGDVARWLHTNDRTDSLPGNPFICGPCDPQDDMKLHQILHERYVIAETHFWWMSSEPLSKAKYEQFFGPNPKAGSR